MTNTPQLMTTECLCAAVCPAAAIKMPLPAQIAGDSFDYEAAQVWPSASILVPWCAAVRGPTSYRPAML